MSSLDDLTKEAVARQGRVVTGDTDPVEGFYWRSDHVEFAMGGVPFLATSPGHRFRRQAGGLGRSEARRIHHEQLSQAHRPD